MIEEADVKHICREVKERGARLIWIIEERAVVG